MPQAKKAAPTRLLAGQVTVGMPTIVTVVLAVLATGLQVVNQQVLTSNPQWQGVIATFLVFLVGVGVGPLTGGLGIRTWIHLPPVVAVIITAFVSALTGALQVVHMSPGLHTGVAAVLTFLAALGFGAASEAAK